jgi:hypothetical protein
MIVKNLRRAAIVLGVGFLGVSSMNLNAQSSVPLIFENGWENQTSLGCSLSILLDGNGWNDYGPSSSCTSDIARITNAERHDGNRALQVNFRPDGSINGPDFRIIQDLGGNRSQVYARWYVKYSPNWRWASADHKVAIFGNSSYTQDVYFNVRGNGNGGQGRVAVHVIPSDTVLSDPTSNMEPGVWHLCEIRIVSGSGGRVEVKLDGRLLNLQSEAGRSASASNLNTGSGVAYIKLDTTYNAYSYPSSLGLTMQAYYDSVAVSTQGWVGGTSGSGSGGGGISGPTAPSNVRIVGS